MWVLAIIQESKDLQESKSIEKYIFIIYALSIYPQS